MDKVPCYAILQMIKEKPNIKDQRINKSTQTETSLLVGLSFESCEKKIIEILEKNTINISIILNQIESDFGEIDSLSNFVFIRALVSAVCRSCLDKENGFEEFKFINLCPLLSVFINNIQEYEYDALFAIKALQQEMKYETGMFINQTIYL